MDVKTKHVVFPPNMHKVVILSGPLKGTSFTEYYEISKTGTEIKIFVSLQLNGFLKYIPLLDRLLAKQMNKVMDKFITCSEIYANVNSIYH
ncbi:MAG: hypothetical protein ACQ9CV_04800 [Nitrosopumilus sp.]